MEVYYLCRQIVGLPAVLFSIAVERNCKQEQRGKESIRIILYVVFGLFFVGEEESSEQGTVSYSCGSISHGRIVAAFAEGSCVSAFQRYQ